MDVMADTASAQLDVRQRQLRYEDRTEQIRRRIDGLIGAYADLHLSLEDQQPTIQDDYYRLDQLDTSLRNCINQLLPLITGYDNSVAEWDQWDDYMQATTTDTPWTRQVYRVRMMFFKDESRLPPLPEKVQQLIQDYNNTIVAVRTCRDALDAQAHAQAALNAARSSRSSNSIATSRASTPNPAAAHPAANGANPAAAHPAANGPQVVQSPRDTPNSAATHTMTNENRGVLSTASTNASAPTTADELRRRARRFEELNAKDDATPRFPAARSSQSPVADPPRSAQSPRPTSQPSTTAPTDGTAPQRSILKQRKQQVPIVTELDHGDRSPPGQENDRNDGFFGDFLPRRQATWYPEADLPSASLFSVTDGNVRAPSRPAALDKTTAKSGFYTDFNVTRPTPVATFSAPPTAPTQPSGGGTTVAPQRSATPVGPTPHSGYGTTGHEAVLPPSVSPPLASSNSSQAPDHTRTTTHHHAADDRGRTNLTPPHPTPPPSDQHVAVNAPANAPATHTTDPEAASAFYRAANCSYKLSRSIAPPALVLKEIPIEPFEGDIRKYPTFRARFLETMNSYQDLEPRHRLQYLLQYLKGTPRKLVEPFPLTDEYYWTAIDFLADPVDQVDNSSAPPSRHGSFTRNFRGAFSSRRQSTPSTAPTPAQSTQPSEQSTDVWNTVASDNAKAARERQAKNTRGNWRPRGAFTTVRTTTTRPPQPPAQQQEPPSAAAAPTTSAADSDPWAATDSEPWGSSQQADPAHSAGDARPSQDKRTDPTHSVGNATQPQVDRPSTSNATTTSSQSQIPASSTAARLNNQELIPSKPILDQNTLPAYPSPDAIKREVLQCFSFETGPQAQQIAKVNDEALASQRKRKPQDTDFGVYYRNRDFGTMHWDTNQLCYGDGEDRSHFHQSIRVHRLIVKTTWTKFRFIAERQDLLYLLDKVLNLRVLSFGHMILLQFANRLRGDHDRMGAVLQFIYDMLKATDFDVAIPRIINRYHAAMTRGVDPKDAFPIERDLRISVELWLGYCHQAFVYFVTHISGRITWSTEWLQSTGLDNAFRRAIRENVLNKTHSAFQDLRYRVYEHYVLRRIHALETGDSAYGWARLPAAKNANDFEGRFRIFTTTVGKTIIFLTEEIEKSAFVKTLKKDDVLINRMPSTNRADVIFWFGHSYANNGNRDLGLLIAELCYHYTTYFGRVGQCVILPAYDRKHREVWTTQALCLYLQRELIVPHAQVILHPYDLRLWQADQPTVERGATLPAWTNRHQTEEGNVHKFGAIETRKSNMRACHGLDLWTWYMEDHPGEVPPPELNGYFTLPTIRPRGQALAAQLAAAGNQAADGAAAAHPAANAVVVRNPQPGTATAHSAVNATQTGPSATVQRTNIQPAPAASPSA